MAISEPMIPNNALTDDEIKRMNCGTLSSRNVVMSLKLIMLESVFMSMFCLRKFSISMGIVRFLLPFVA